MYWRVRTVTPEDLMRQYGVHIALGISLLLNLILFATRPNPNSGVIKKAQADFIPFADKVTKQLLDSSYISYEQSTQALIQGGELAPSVIAQMQKSGALPKSMDEIKATARTLNETKECSAVRLDSVSPGDPNPQGLIPITVSGVLAKHSSDESGPTEPVPFHFQYLMGFRKSDDPNVQLPIVAGFSER